MAFSESEKQRCEKLVRSFLEKHRPPKRLRDQVDLDFRIEKQSIVIFELRSAWNNPGEKMEIPVVKTTYVRTQDIWRIFWQRSDLKWHLYNPDPEAKTLEDVLQIVDDDSDACFWG